MLRTLVLCALVSLALTTPAWAQLDPDINHPGLTVEWMYETQGFISSMAVGDLDGDGFPDLVVPDSGAIRVWWNDGHARFDQRTAVADSQGVRSFTVVDADGDGRNDLVLGSAPSGVVVLRGLGGRVFGSPIASPTGMELDQIATADMNRDGRPDLVGVSRTGRGIEIALNLGDGSFAAAGTGALEQDGSALCVADFDGDGLLDVAAAPTSTGIRVFRGDGKGGLTSFSDIQRGFGDLPRTLVAVDLDQDGDADLLSTSAYYGVNVDFNDGYGRFAGFVREDWNGDLPIGLAVLHLGQGPPEVVEAGSSGYGGHFEVFHTGADPSLEHGDFYSYYHHFNSNLHSLAPSQIIAADLDGDQREDLVMLTPHEFVEGIGFLGSLVGIVRSRPDGLFDGIRYQDAPPVSGLRTAHLSSGHDADILMFTANGIERTHLLPNGVLETPRVIARGVGAWPLDVDGDGRDDLAIQITTDSLAVRLTRNDGELGPEVARWAGQWVGAADFGGAPGPEIVFMDPTGHVAIAWNHPQRPYTRVTPTRVTGPVEQLVLARSDGRMRLIRLGVESHHGEDLTDTLVVFAIGAGGQVSEVGHELLIPPESFFGQFNEIRSADLDGRNGDELLILRNEFASGADIQVLRSTGGGQYVIEESNIVIRSEGAGAMLTADLDGDGDRDILWSAQNPANTGRIEIAWNDGDAHFDHRWIRHTADSYTRYPVADDLNGDGSTDVLFTLRRFAGGSNAGIGILFGEQPHSTVANARPGMVQPRSAELARTGLRLASANPVSGSMRVAFTLDGHSNAALELFDLSGRRVFSRPLEGFGVGSRVVTIPVPANVTSGVYWLALREAGTIETRRITILR